MERWISGYEWRIALACVVAACATTRAPADPASSRAGLAMDGSQRGYLLIADGSVHLSGEGEPTGLFVSGTMEGGRFVPEGDVQGDGPIGTAGTPGWLELLDGSFTVSDTGREPLPPYVAGAMTPEGIFSPTSRQVAY